MTHGHPSPVADEADRWRSRLWDQCWVLLGAMCGIYLAMTPCSILVAMAIVLSVMVAVLCGDDRRSRRLGSRSPSGSPTTTAGSTMCATA